jgi:ABC-type lipoprotein release transport system permease subunit
LWGRNPFAQSSRDAILDSARRLNGDVMVLSLDYPPPDIEQVHNLAARMAGVIDASIVAIWEVQLESVTTTSPALLELRGLYRTHAALPRVQGPQPMARSPERPPELAIGRLLAKRLGVSRGDSVTVHVKAGAGTTGTASKLCKVVAIAELGLDYFDERVVLADISHLSDFALMPTGVSVQLSSPDTRAKFANDLQYRLNPRWRTIQLEDLFAPLLRSGSDVAAAQQAIAADGRTSL